MIDNRRSLWAASAVFAFPYFRVSQRRIEKIEKIQNHQFEIINGPMRTSSGILQTSGPNDDQLSLLDG